MATTVAQHSVATFTSPVNGTTPIDANTVRGNDNTIRTAYNDHDSDPGIHVQSSTLASRPVAGTAGRKWITEDSGVYTLWFDDGTNWHPVSSENIALTVLAGENLVKGDVVKVTGWNNGQDLPEVVKTTSASDTAFAVITAAVSSGSMGYATNTGIVQDVNTAAYSVGTILYANGSGGFTSTKPTSGHYQPVAYVLRSNTNNGVYYVEFSTPRIVERSDNTASTVVLRDASGNFSAGTITATAINATTLDLTNLEVTNIKAKDGTQAIAIADTTGKLTISDGVLLSALTASQAVFTDGSKNLVSNAITGTGNVVMSASPTLTGTITAADVSMSGILTIGTDVALSRGAANRLDLAAGDSFNVSSGNYQIGGTTVLSSTTLGSGVTGSSLTSVGTIATGVWQGTAIANAYIATGLDVGKLTTGATLPNNVTASSLTSVGTLSSLTVSGDLTVDTSTLKVDSANNRVGIGTASPAGYKLDIVGDTTGVASGNTPALRLRHAGDGGVETRFENGTGALARIVAGVTSAGAGTDDGTLVFATAANSVLSDRMTLDASGNLAVDTNTLYVDAANNRVGVGTASPLASVDIRSGDLLFSSVTTTANSTLASIGVYQNGYPAANRYASIDFLNGPSSWFSGSAIVFKTNGSADTTANAPTEKMRLDGPGNLGLGVTPSAWGSTINALQMGTASFAASKTGNTAAGSMYVNSFFDGTNFKYVAADYATRYASFSGQHVWYTAPSGANAGDPITFVQAMTLDASGYLLLNGTQQYTRVTVKGSAGVPNGYGILGATATTGCYFGAISATANDDFEIWNERTGYLRFATANIERARITSGGYFKASDAGTYLSATGTYHELRQSVSDWTVRARNTHGTPYGVEVQYTTDINNTGSEFLYCVGNAALRASIRSNGGLANYQSNNVDLSDIRTKTDIAPAASMWSKIGALEIVTYKYTDQTHDDVNVGVIAQQVETVEPVWVDADGFGKTPADGVPLKTVYTKDITFAAIKALQEAMARIETLEQRVLALEA